MCYLDIDMHLKTHSFFSSFYVSLSTEWPLNYVLRTRRYYTFFKRVFNALSVAALVFWLTVALPSLFLVSFECMFTSTWHDEWEIDDLLDHTISKDKTVNITYSTQSSSLTVLVLRTWSALGSLTCRAHSVGRCDSSSRFRGPFSQRRPAIAARSLCWSERIWYRPAPADLSAAPIS